MIALKGAGQMSNQRYIDLTFIAADHDEEEEQRDLTRATKNTKPLLTHSNYTCIG